MNEYKNKKLNLFMCLYIQIENKIKFFIELYELLNRISFYYNEIIIYCNQEYILFNQQLFFSLNNVSIININKSKNINFIKYLDQKSFIKSLNLDLSIISNIDNKTNHDLICRNIKEEDYYYNQLKKNTGKYIFFYNTNKNRLINYFGNIYIFNPIINFYNKDHENYNKWIDLKIKNIFNYLKIMMYSEQLHIYDLNILELILLYNNLFVHINEKYLYITKDDIYIKKDEPKLKNWKTIIIT